MVKSGNGATVLRGRRLYLRAIEFVIASLFYYIVYYSQNKHSTCFRQSNSTWCFSRMPIVESITLATILLVRCKYQSRVGKIYTVITSWTAMLIIGTLAIIRGHDANAIEATGDLFETILVASSIFSATAISWNSGLELIQYASLKNTLIAGLLSRVLFAIAPSIATALDTPKLRVTTFLVLSLVLTCLVCINSVRYKRRSQVRERARAQLAFNSELITDHWYGESIARKDENRSHDCNYHGVED